MILTTVTAIYDRDLVEVALGRIRDDADFYRVLDNAQLIEVLNEVIATGDEHHTASRLEMCGAIKIDYGT